MIKVIYDYNSFKLDVLVRHDLCKQLHIEKLYRLIEPQRCSYRIKGNRLYITLQKEESLVTWSELELKALTGVSNK